MLVVGACEVPRQPGVLAPVEGFAGLVAGDEPRAVTIGRDVIGNGGTAADAAVAMYFAMTVSLPSRVGIAGGGICIAHNSGLGNQKGAPFVDVIQFLPDPAVPDRPQFAGPRALAVLHARHGATRWEVLLNDAERMARGGFGISRAFASDLSAAAGFVSANPDLRNAFSNRSGVLAREGDQITLLELSGLISGLRRQGAGYLYSGAFANRLVESASALGVPITSQQLRDSIPVLSEPLAIPYGDSEVYFAPTPSDGGVLTAQIWGMLTQVEDYKNASPADRVHMLAEAGQRAFGARGSWLGRDVADRGSSLVAEAHLKKLMAGYSARQHSPAAMSEGRVVAPVSNPFTAGFVVADRWSSAVACSFTMNGLFGDGIIVPGTGVLLPKPTAEGANDLTAAIIANKFNGTVYFAGTASGGLAAPSALAEVMLGSQGQGADLEAALAAPRVINVAEPGTTFYEPSMPAEIVSALRQRGHDLQSEAAVGHANALVCPGGLRNETISCQVAADRRGFGLGVLVQ